jgi:hypothetical protein
VLFDIYKRSDGDACRYLLGRKGHRPLFVVGLNPSTATAEKSDTTVSKVARTAEVEGFDGFVMLNLCSLRSTNPSQLPAELDPGEARRNVSAIEEAARGVLQPTVWAAWGMDIETRPYLLSCLWDIAAVLPTANWLHHGPLTKHGHPRHPSRMSYSNKFSVFDVKRYAAAITSSRRA